MNELNNAVRSHPGWDTYYFKILLLLIYNKGYTWIIFYYKYIILYNPKVLLFVNVSVPFLSTAN